MTKENNIYRFKSGMEIVKDYDENNEVRYTVVDPKGYLGRTRVATCLDYVSALEQRREYEGRNY